MTPEETPQKLPIKKPGESRTMAVLARAAPSEFTREVLLSGDNARLIAVGKKELQDIHQRDAERIRLMPGERAACILSDEVDNLLRGIYLFHRLRLRNSDQPVATRNHALIAIGGTGRRQLSLHSDLDLQFLVTDKVDGPLKELITKFYQSLWDIGLEPAQLVRTQQECLKFLGNDFVSATALLSTRHLCGHPVLASQLLSALRKALNADGRHARWFTQTLQDYEKARHEAHGDTEYVIEPDVKEGVGGLRDHHLLEWWLFTQPEKRSLRALHQARLLSSADFQRLRDSYNFLLSVRANLHHQAGRKNDTLHAEVQRPIAEAMRFRASTNQLAEESFMRAYFLHAHRTRYIRRRLMRNEGGLPSPSLVGRFVGRIAGARRIEPYFYLREEHLQLDEGRLERWRADPDGLMRVWLKMAQSERWAGGRAIELCRARTQKENPEDLQKSEYANKAFLKILGAKGWATRTIRLMHDAGTLSAIIPEFEHLRCLVRADQYHLYTVDEHTFRVLGNAEKLWEMEPQESPLARAVRRIENWPMFMLGLLLHDVGKGLGRGHALRGATMTATIGKRMGIPREERDFAAYLVREHLKMSHLAFRRDVTDPSVARELAKVAETAERLDALFVLTYSDIKAVSPELWNDWKEQLLTQLYIRTRALLVGEPVAEIESAPDSQLVSDVTSILTKVYRKRGAEDPIARAEEAVNRYWNDFPEAYLAQTPPEVVTAHLRILQEREAGNTLDWYLIERDRFGQSLLVIVAPDVPGLFHMLARGFASRDLSIERATCFSTDDGLAIDQFTLTFKGQPLPSGFNLTRLRKRLAAIIAGEDEMQGSLGAIPALPASDPELEKLAPTEIKISNDLSDKWTVCEVRTHDRTGLLSHVSGVFNEVGLSVHQALITTEAYRVVDVFYLSTLDNNKLDDRRRLKGLSRKLHELLKPASGDESMDSSINPEPKKTGTVEVAEKK